MGAGGSIGFVQPFAELLGRALPAHRRGGPGVRRPFGEREPPPRGLEEVHAVRRPSLRRALAAAAPAAGAGERPCPPAVSRPARSGTWPRISCGWGPRASAGPSRWSGTCSATSWSPAAGSRRRSTATAWPWPSSPPGRWPRSSPCTWAGPAAGRAGAALVGLAFVLPSFLMVLAIAVGYLRFGGLPWMQGAFYGIGAAVIAIIARSAVKLTRLTLGADRLLWALFAVAALVTAWTESEIVWVFLGAGVRGPARAGAAPGRAPARPRRWSRCRPASSTGLGGEPATAATLWRIALVLRGGRGLRVRQRPGHRPVPARRRRPGVPLAGRAAVPGRGGGGDDHARAGGDHRGLHRLPGGRPGGRGGRGPRRRSCPATSSPCSRPPLPAPVPEPVAPGVRRRRDRGGHRRDRRGGRSSSAGGPWSTSPPWGSPSRRSSSSYG